MMSIAAALLALFAPLHLAAQELSFEDFDEIEPATTSMTQDKVRPESNLSRASRSEYFHLPMAKHSVVSLSYQHASTRYLGNVQRMPHGYLSYARTQENVQDYAFALKYGVSKNWYLDFGAGYRATTRKYQGYGSSEYQGLRDFDLGLSYFLSRQSFSLITGVSVSGSPYDARQADEFSDGNSFSGAIRVKPMVGIEAPLNKGVWGVTTAIEAVVAGRYEYLETTDPILSGQGFFEFPISTYATMGASVGMKIPMGYSVLNEDSYLGRIYSSLHAIKDTAFTAHLDAETTERGQSITSVGVGIRQSL